jgi:hypothetical protein
VAVSGARVTLRLQYPNGSSVSLSATTSTTGYATFTRTVTATGSYSIEVTNVTKSRWTYDASHNAITTASVMIP